MSGYNNILSDVLFLPREIVEGMFDFTNNRILTIPEYNIIESVSEWAERKRSIGKGLTARPGPVEFKLTPYLREIANCLSDNSPVQEIYVIKGTQLGFTVMVLENHMGYCIDYGIGPVLFISGDQAMAEESFEKRVDEMIESAGLQGKIRANVKKKTGKSTGDRTDSKSYGGTFMRAIGPNSESKLRSFPAKILYEDEMDVYPVRIIRNGTDSGDTLLKAERRMDSYGNQKKIMGGSTPKSQSSSRIARKVEEGDARLYNFRCPACDFQQPFLWQGFNFEKDEKGNPAVKVELINGVESITQDPTYYVCQNESCGHKIKDKDKLDLLQEIGHGGTAQWVPTKKADRPFVRSYKLPSWYGFRTWLEIRLEYERVKDDPFLFPDFVNDVMGETWKENVNKPDENELLTLAQEYELWPRGYIKKDVLFLTLAADIQKDRIEAGLMGWGYNRQVYMIEYWTFAAKSGDTNAVEDECWKQLSEQIQGKYIREDGQELFVQYAFIDSQYNSSTVDLFCDSFPYSDNAMSGVFPIQSRETIDKTVKQFQSNIKTPVIGLHDQQLKRVLYNLLRKRPHGPAMFPNFYLHFSHEYGNEFYKQLTSEDIVEIKVRGEVKGIKILNTKQRRNEVLDIVKMNLGAFQYAMDRYFKKYNEWAKLQKQPEIQEDAGMFFDMIAESLRG